MALGWSPTWPTGECMLVWMTKIRAGSRFLKYALEHTQGYAFCFAMQGRRGGKDLVMFLPGYSSTENGVT